jgi:hypothetical protein
MTVAAPSTMLPAAAYGTEGAQGVMLWGVEVVDVIASCQSSASSTRLLAAPAKPCYSAEAKSSSPVGSVASPSNVLPAAGAPSPAAAAELPTQRKHSGRGLGALGT